MLKVWCFMSVWIILANFEFGGIKFFFFKKKSQDKGRKGWKSKWYEKKSTYYNNLD